MSVEVSGTGLAIAALSRAVARQRLAALTAKTDIDAYHAWDSAFVLEARAAVLIDAYQASIRNEIGRGESPWQK